MTAYAYNPGSEEAKAGSPVWTTWRGPVSNIQMSKCVPVRNFTKFSATLGFPPLPGLFYDVKMKLKHLLLRPTRFGLSDSDVAL